MKRENDEITDLFRSSLGHTEMTVREGFWEELNHGVAISGQRRQRMVFFRIAAAASVLLVLAASSAAIWYFSPKEEMEKAFTQLAVSGVGALDGDRVNQAFSPACNQPVLQKPAPKSFGMLALHKEEEDDSVSVTVSLSFSFSASTTHRSREEARTDEVLWKAGGGAEPTPSDLAEQAPVMASTAPTVAKIKETRTWAVKAAVGTALPAKAGKYKMPVITDVTVEKMLNKHLAIEAGLQYSNLRSKGQNLHYLGIPVKMNVYLANTKNLDVYASIGGIADKCIAGAPDNDFGNEPIQLALTAGVGINYKINDRIALFAEPGVSHHFKTDSKLETIRTKRATNFNLICGLRMTY